MPTDGINRLISASQLKSATANEEALEGADSQRGLVKRERRHRAADASIDEGAGDAMARSSAPLKTTGHKMTVRESKSPLAEMAPDPSLDPLSEERTAEIDEGDPPR